jgi:hypothetical protein
MSVKSTSFAAALGGAVLLIGSSSAVVAQITPQVPTWFISSDVSDGQGHRLCLTNEGRNELVQLQVCNAKRPEQKWWLRTDDTGAFWFIGTGANQDQGYVLAVPPKVEVGNYFSLRHLDFTKRWQNWMMDGGEHSATVSPIHWQFGPDYPDGLVMQPVSNQAGSHLVVAERSFPRKRKEIDPIQVFRISAEPP